MSKDIREMRDEIRAPRYLIEAVKKGERVAPKRKTDTNATHIRRFSKAFAVYACAAILLVIGSIALPALLSESATPQSRPSEEVLPTEAFVRPDLVWADETNLLSQSVAFSWYEHHELETEWCKAGRWLNLPDYPDDAVYAVEVKTQDILGFLSGDTKPSKTTPAPFVKYLTETEGWERFIGPDGQLCFAVTKAQIEALDTAALYDLFVEVYGSEISYDLNRDEAPTNNTGGEFQLTIAWQSPSGAPPIETWQATQWDTVDCH